MIDLILASAGKSFLNEYSSSALGIVSTIAGAIVGNTSVTSGLESKNDAAMNKINEFINKTRREG